MLLVRTPHPFPTESFPGYLIRVAEANGYDSIAHVLSVAGLSPRWRGGWKIEVDRIEQILNLPSGQLHHIANTRPALKQSKALLLGQDVSRSFLTGSKPRICPDCITEAGYIEANWDLHLMVACPKHRRDGVSECRQCGEPLSLYRPKLLECRCGASLRGHTRETVDENILELQSLLVATVQGRADKTASTSGMPVEDLSSMSLRSLTTTIARLGKYSIESCGLEDTGDPTLIVKHATQVLSDWPNGFRALLHRINSKNTSKNTSSGSSFRKRFGQLYDSLFKRGLPPKEVDFLRKALLEFGTNEWPDGTVDPRLLREIPLDCTRYQSISQLARDAGVMPSTARRMVRNGLVAMIKIDRKGNHRFVGESATPSRLKRVPGRSLSVREAAAELAIPVSVLSELRSSGQFEVRHIGATLKSFHELDVQAFDRKCLAAAERICAQGTNRPVVDREATIELGHALKTLPFRTGGGKHDLVAAFLEGRLRCHGRSGNGMSNILLDAREVQRFVLDVRSSTAQSSRSADETATMIGCSEQILSSLLDQGFLTRTSQKPSLRISDESIKNFCNTYISLVTIANNNNSSTKCLSKMCKQHNIRTISADYKNSRITQYFIKKSEELSLILALTENRNKKKKRANSEAPIDKLKRYLDNLRKENSRLPRRGGAPYKFAIARSAGVDRCIFYKTPRAVELLKEFDAEERSRMLIDPCDNFDRLRQYLANLERNSSPLPRSKHGRPNMLKIANACRFKRDAFYRNKDMVSAIEAFDKIRQHTTVGPSALERTPWRKEGG